MGKHEKYKKYASCEKNDAQQRILSSSPKVCNKQKSDIAVPLVIEQNIQSKYPEGNWMSMLASFEGFILFRVYNNLIDCMVRYAIFRVKAYFL